jgi:hypothetical protein
MQQVTMLHFLHDEAIVARRYTDDVHRFVAGWIKR